MCRKPPFADARCGCQIATNKHKGRTISSRTPFPDRTYSLHERAINMCQSHGHCRKVCDRELTLRGHRMHRCDFHVCAMCCANQSSLSRYNFGGCLATIASKGGISNSRYTRFERTYPHWVLSSNAGDVARIESQVAAGAETGRSMSDISLLVPQGYVVREVYAEHGPAWHQRPL